MEKLFNLAQSQENLNALVATWQYAVDNHPGEFSDGLDRLNYFKAALALELEDVTSHETEFFDREFDELSQYGGTPRMATLRSRDGFRLALGCFAL